MKLNAWLEVGSVALMLHLTIEGTWVGSYSLPGKPLYALKQRLVSSTITAPPICMSQHDATLIQAVLLVASSHKAERHKNQTPAQQLVCISL